MQIETVKITTLKLDPKNARRHDERSINAIAESLATFGQRKPIVATAKGLVVTGNGTLQAAKKLGWDSVEVARIPADWDEAKITAFAIADNRTSEMSDWDTAQLLATLESMDDATLQQISFDPGAVIDLIEKNENPFEMIRMAIADLKPHPRNYQRHPEDQLEEIVASIKTHGFYRNIIVARDNTILAGHGVVLAATKMGKKRVPVIRLDIDSEDPRAIKVMTSDNEIGNLAETDDRALTELLRELLETSGADGLLGTGFDEYQLAALTYTTRPATEIPTKDVAAEWVGMPDYEPAPKLPVITVRFENTFDRDEFLDRIGAKVINKKIGDAWAIWYPEKERRDVSSVKFE